MHTITYATLFNCGATKLVTNDSTSTIVVSANIQLNANFLEIATTFDGD